LYSPSPLLSSPPRCRDPRALPSFPTRRSSDLFPLRAGASALLLEQAHPDQMLPAIAAHRVSVLFTAPTAYRAMLDGLDSHDVTSDRKSTRLNSSHVKISYAVFCLKKKITPRKA